MVGADHKTLNYDKKFEIISRLRLSAFNDDALYLYYRSHIRLQNVPIRKMQNYFQSGTRY